MAKEPVNPKAPKSKPKSSIPSQTKKKAVKK